MRYLSKNPFSMPDAAFLMAGASYGSLVFALIMQFGFGVQPCELCLWQRVPFILAGSVALIAALLQRFEKLSRILLGLCALLFFLNAGLALFHSGVERHWWEFHSACTGSALSPTDSVEDLRQQLLATPVVRCDAISWSLVGITMANMNVVFSCALAMFALAAATRRD